MKQRVAIARALAVEPQVMLLDEPLSALDLKLRQHMRAELRAIQKKTGVTFIYITHDQGEAFTMSDRVAVMSRGVLEQVGTPREIYDDPATPFVATFVGENNAFAGTVSATRDGFAEVTTGSGTLRGRAGHGIAPGSPGVLFVRPERLTPPSGVHDQANTLAGRVTHVDFEGSFANVFLRDPSGQAILVQLPNDGTVAPPAEGIALHVAFDPQGAIVLPDGPRART